MVTATKDTHISWDAFLEKADRLAVESFRELEWPNIKRELGQAPFNTRLAEGLEPHWVRSGKAVYWQPVILRKRMEETDEDGRMYYNEGIEEEIPPEVMERMGRHKYYCVLHDKGFDSKKLTDTHYSIETRRPGSLYHPTVEEMYVKGEADADKNSATKRNRKTKS
jgi:hypothetical protein